MQCIYFYLLSIENELANNFEHVNNLTKDDIVNTHKQFCNDNDIKFDEKLTKLPFLYATAKQHKIPAKFRFISSTVGASVKQVCVALKHILKCVQDQVISRCKYFDHVKHKFKVKSCFIINNNAPVRESIFKLNSLPKPNTNLSSFDFDTLYTSLPHDKIKETLHDIIDDAFNYRDVRFIRVSYNRA